jgi:RNA polymerase sigma-70 factor (ECF subfamily)
MGNNIVKKFQEKKTIFRLRNQDREAFIKVYDDHSSELYRFIYFKVGNREEARDLASMVFLKAWNHVQSKNLVESKTLRALLYKIARTSIIDYYREKAVRQTVSLDDPESGALAIADDSNLELDADQQANLRLLQDKLPLIKDDYREALVLRFVNELSLEEIADVMGKSKGNVRVIIHRAIAALKEVVQEGGEEL